MAERTKKNLSSNEQDKHKIKELTEALQRERADSINLRRRYDEELSKVKIYQKANLIHELLPVIDNFNRALRHVPKELSDNQFVKGIEAIHKQFDSFLSNLGVERIKTVGQTFNPQIHEAVSLEEGEGNREVVSEEIQAGYKLGDEIIRHATVKVKLSN